MQNRDAFQGTEIIAKQLTTKNLSVAKGKRVVVIGSAKSALDVAGAAGEVAESVTMLCRQVTLRHDMHRFDRTQQVAILHIQHDYPGHHTVALMCDTNRHQ